MMLIILDKYPDEAAKKLIKLTSDKFVFKQCLELAQLICSAGISCVYKKVPQGKRIQEWITVNPLWVYIFFTYLAHYLSVQDRMKFSDKTLYDWNLIDSDLLNYIRNHYGTVGPVYTSIPAIETAIWRYSKTYISSFSTNTELPSELITQLYTDYITQFKFPPKKMTALYC